MGNRLLRYEEIKNDDKGKTHDASMLSNAYEKLCEKAYGEHSAYLVVCEEKGLHAFSSASEAVDGKVAAQLASAAVGEMTHNLQKHAADKEVLYYKGTPIVDELSLLYLLYDNVSNCPMSEETREKFLKGEL